MKILWAIDCFGGSHSSIKAGARFLTKLSKSCSSEITIFPVSVMGPIEFQWFINAGIKDSPLHYLEKTLRKHHLSGQQYPKVISDSGYSISSSIKALDSFGRKHKCDLILCTTKSKPGMKTTLLGSFAESLVTRSKTPLLLVHPDNASAFNPERVLFSTDLSTSSKVAFKKLMPFAKLLKSKVHVLHCAFQQSDWAAALAMVESYQYLSGLPFQVSETNFNRDQKWFENTSKSAGIKAKFDVSKTYTQIPEEVIRVANKERAGYLALTTHSGPLSANLLGSTTRRILRLSTRPILVLK